MTREKVRELKEELKQLRDKNTSAVYKKGGLDNGDYARINRQRDILTELRALDKGSSHVVG